MGESLEKVEKRTKQNKKKKKQTTNKKQHQKNVFFSTSYDRQYDIGMIDLDAGHTVTGGHLAYIQY